MYYTLSSFASELSGQHIIMHSDNTVTVSCLRKKGSSDSLRDSLTRKIFQLGVDHNFTITSTRVSTKQNFMADKLSRRIEGNRRTEWSLSLGDFQIIMGLLTWAPEIDLFTSHLNNKLPYYCSRARDPHNSWVDAFTLNWNGKKCYCFCPFSIVGKTLRKIQNDKVENMAMIIPLHPSSAWFPLFLHLAKDPPFLLPGKIGRQLFLLWDETIRHPLAKNMRLLLGDLCYSCYNIEKFQPGQPATLWNLDGDIIPIRDTTTSSRIGRHFAHKRRWIHMK